MDYGCTFQSVHIDADGNIFTQADMGHSIEYNGRLYNISRNTPVRVICIPHALPRNPVYENLELFKYFPKCNAQLLFRRRVMNRGFVNLMRACHDPLEQWRMASHALHVKLPILQDRNTGYACHTNTCMTYDLTARILGYVIYANPAATEPRYPQGNTHWDQVDPIAGPQFLMHIVHACLLDQGSEPTPEQPRGPKRPRRVVAPSFHTDLAKPTPPSLSEVRNRCVQVAVEVAMPKEIAKQQVINKQMEALYALLYDIQSDEHASNTKRESDEHPSNTKREREEAAEPELDWANMTYKQRKRYMQRRAYTAPPKQINTLAVIHEFNRPMASFGNVQSNQCFISIS
jgi:hypothetical protein